MMNAIRHDELPRFYFMQYDLVTWRVRNLLLVPHFAFPPSAIIKRKPLSRTARRVLPPQYLLRRTGRLGWLQFCPESHTCRSPDSARHHP